MDLPDLLKILPMIIGLIAGILGATGSVIAYYFYKRRIAKRTQAYTELLKRHVKSLIKDLKNEDSDVRGRAAYALGKTGDKRTVWLSLLGSFKILPSQGRLDKIESGLKELRKLLLDNPEASVTIPLIKKDIDSLKEDYKHLREEITRMNDFTKWVHRNHDYHVHRAVRVSHKYFIEVMILESYKPCYSAIDVRYM